jgi:acyl dehydratase
MTRRVFADVHDLEAHTGTHLGYSDWHVVDQTAVNLFADATDDHQWIHTDPGRAEHGPFGGTVAHGYFTLALVPKLADEVYAVDHIALVINYGADRVRFPAPVVTGSSIRAGVELLDVAVGDGGCRVTDRVTVEIAGSAKPACVVETISMLVPMDT